jgi:hypothetical protein
MHRIPVLLEILLIDMVISSIWPDILLFSVSGIRKVSSGNRPDTGYKKGRINRLDIRCIPKFLTTIRMFYRTAMGGPNAPLSPAESVTGLLSLIDAFQPAAQNGNFYDYSGKQLSW